MNKLEIIKELFSYIKSLIDKFYIKKNLKENRLFSLFMKDTDVEEEKVTTDFDDGYNDIIKEKMELHKKNQYKIVFPQKEFKDFLLKQNNPIFPQPVRDWGCNFTSCLAGGQIYLRKLLTPQEFMELVRISQSKGAVKEDMSLIKPRILLDEFFTMMGHPEVYGYQAGKVMPNGEKLYWNEWCREQGEKFSILRGDSMNNHEHFRNGDTVGKLFWDPYLTKEGGDVLMKNHKYALLYNIRKRG